MNAENINSSEKAESCSFVSETPKQEFTHKSHKRKNTEKLSPRKKLQFLKSDDKIGNDPSQESVDMNQENANTVEEVLEDMEEEIDHALEHRENKSKLTPANVKNILRHIIANEYVLAMVRNTMKLQNSDGEEIEEVSYEPKLTRSKAKEMRKKQYTLPWPVSSPAKKVDKVSKQLLEEEFPDECSSDEDYKPTEEECPSDEDDISSIKTSEFGSPHSRKSETSPISKSTELLSEDESSLVIALPEQESTINVSANSSEADKIALRTRSKLCLNDTPLEAIEASFIAPDITMDMYDTHCDDEEWQEFLSELSRPIDSIVVANQPGEEIDDAEDDPEYKIVEEDIPDYYDLRYDNSVQISRDELNALMAEILEYAQKDLSYLDDDEILVDNQVSPVDSLCDENVQTQWMSDDERLQLDEQMRMYVQLLAQAYLLSHGNPKLNFINVSAKLFLDEIKMFASRDMATNEKSAFYAQNLDSALKIIDEYEDIKPMRGFVQYKKNSLPSVPQHVRKTLARSKVFIYPELLPMCGFHYSFERRKTYFILPEDNLIALGMEQFEGVKKSVEYIQSLLVPTKSVEQIKIRIKNSKVKKDPLCNPIKYYHVYKQAPQFQRVIRIFDPENIKAPEDYPPDILPKWMAPYSKIVSNPVIAPNQSNKPTQEAIDPPKIAVVRPMFRKPMEARKLAPILPRLHGSPFKHISPILKKYSQQRRVVTVLPFSSSSPLKNKPINKLPLKPKLCATVQKIVNSENDNSNSSKPSILLCDSSDSALNVNGVPKCETVINPSTEKVGSNSSTVQIKLPPRPSLENQTILESEVSESIQTEQFSSETQKLSVPYYKRISVIDGPIETEICDEVDEEIIEDEHDLATAVTVPNSSTTNKKHSVSKKRNRIQRDMEASLALLQPKIIANDPKKEEREALFANSYLLRATEILKGNPEVYEKFLMTLCKYHHSTRSPVELYSEIKEILKDYPTLVRDFIVFLRPEQAKECGQYKEHVALSKIREFFRKVEMHFKNQPQHISRILKTFAHLQQQVDITSAEVISALQPLLRNQTHLMEELYHLLPDAAPPEYLMTDFEVVNIPNSDDDNSSVDSYEEIIIPDTPDPYGGKDCPCDCHNSSTDNRLLNKSRHCVKCGVKFIDGRIYIQTGKVLKPAQVTYLDSSPAPPDKEKNNPVQQLSKTQLATDAISKCAVIPEVQSKNDTVTSKKDQARNNNVDQSPVLSCNATPLPSSSKLPYDVIEDTVFPTVAGTLNKSVPSDFSHLKAMIGCSSKVGNSTDNEQSGMKNNNQNTKWSRDEDKLIIYNCQRYGISKKAFCSTATALGSRTEEEVEERFLNLMQVLSCVLKKQ